MNQTRFSDCGVFDRSFGQIPVVQGQGRAGSGLCTHLGQHAGLRWMLAVPAASSCDPACASGPALCSSCRCSPCARRLRCRSRLCPHAVTLGGSHQGFAVVGALPLAAGCLHLHGRRLPQMPARLLVLKLERRVVGPQRPMVARASPWGCALPTAAVPRAGLPAAWKGLAAACPRTLDSAASVTPGTPALWMK